MKPIFRLAVPALLLPSLCLAQTAPENVTIAAKRLAKARSTIQASLGATVTQLSAQTIAAQPGGAELPLNQTLLQVPGVSQDSFGQIHLRNDHANIQYRINGVILPEGISFFGQSLTSRFASSLDVITGSLPAQYGLVTTGIVDIETRADAFTQGGSVGMYGGSHGWLEPSADYAGHSGDVNYYVAGDYLHDDIGIENPTASTDPLHDRTEQVHGFGYVEKALGQDSKISLIAGAYHGTFQIPDNLGQAAAFTDGTYQAVASGQLNEHQSEDNDYAALSYLTTGDRYGLQVSGFLRYSALDYTPDPVGDLEFYGLAQQAARKDLSEGVQVDGRFDVSATHTLRYGGLVSVERATATTLSTVFPCLVADCSAVGTTPLSVNGGSGETGATYSLYVQDEWQLAPGLTLNYGVRWDVLNAYTDTQQLSPRVNLVYKPDLKTTLHAGYSRYFTPPQLELISGQSVARFAGTTGYPGGYTPAAPPLDGPILPERSNYLDAGIDRIVLPGLKIGVDGYWKVARDLIDEGQFGAPIILSVFNYAHANVLGVEFSTSYDAGPLSIYGNFSVGRERATQLASQQFDFDPADLAYIAHHYIYTDHSQLLTGSAGTAYAIGHGKVSADLVYGSGLRQDAGDVPNGGVVTPYVQLNLGASYKFEKLLGGPTEFNAAILNVADRSYEIRSGEGVGVFAPQYGPRRAFYAGVRRYF